MDVKKFFKALLDCTSGEARGVLQCVNVMKVADNKCTLCAVDGHILVVAEVNRADIDTALSMQLFKEFKNEDRHYLIPDRVNGDPLLIERPFPDILITIPRMQAVSEYGQVSRIGVRELKKSEAILQAFTGAKQPFYINYQPINHSGEIRPLFLHARIETGLFIGVMPLPSCYIQSAPVSIFEHAVKEIFSLN